MACYCKHCRAFARHLAVPEILDDAGGTALYQTTPEYVTITDGADQLACLRMTSKGPYRWYAACCRTPFANTAATIGVPFVGILTGYANDPTALGPIITRVHTDGATGPLPGRKGSMTRAVLGILKLAAGARLRGAHKLTPFFDPATGAPVARPHILSQEDRILAYGA